MKVKITYTYSDETKVRTATIDIENLANWLNQLYKADVLILQAEIATK